MLQFYFLSVLLNVLAGLVLVYATDFTKAVRAGGADADDAGAGGMFDDGSHSVDSLFDDELPPEDAARADSAASDDESKSARFFKGGTLFDDKTFRLVLGIVSLLVGIMKLLSVVQTDLPVVGDLVPAVAGLVAGATLLLEFYAVHNSVDASFPLPVQKIFFDGRRYIGVFCIIAGLMHFIFPRVLFL